YDRDWRSKRGAPSLLGAICRSGGGQPCTRTIGDFVYCSRTGGAAASKAADLAPRSKPVVTDWRKNSLAPIVGYDRKHRSSAAPRRSGCHHSISLPPGRGRDWGGPRIHI